MFKTADQREAAGETGVNFMSVISEEATGDYADKYDAAFVFANVKGFAQEAAIRIKWSTPMAAEIPWYVTEVPTVFVSLNQPNHLIDVPMVKTAIHAHAGYAGGHPGHHRKDHGQVGVPGNVQRERLLRFLRHPALTRRSGRRHESDRRYGNPVALVPRLFRRAPGALSPRNLPCPAARRRSVSSWRRTGCVVVGRRTGGHDAGAAAGPGRRGGHGPRKARRLPAGFPRRHRACVNHPADRRTGPGRALSASFRRAG